MGNFCPTSVCKEYKIILKPLRNSDSTYCQSGSNQIALKAIGDNLVWKILQLISSHMFIFYCNLKAETFGQNAVLTWTNLESKADLNWVQNKSKVAKFE